MIHLPERLRQIIAHNTTDAPSGEYLEAFASRSSQTNAERMAEKRRNLGHEPSCMVWLNAPGVSCQCGRGKA